MRPNIKHKHLLHFIKQKDLTSNPQYQCTNETYQKKEQTKIANMNTWKETALHILTTFNITNANTSSTKIVNNMKSIKQLNWRAKKRERKNKTTKYKEQNTKQSNKQTCTNSHTDKSDGPSMNKNAAQPTNDYPGRTATLSFYQIAQNQKGQQAP